MRRRSSIAFGFLALIAVGALMLAMPWARNEGTWGNALTSLFTACSAVCVTGLSVVDISSEFTFAGQLTLLVLVELGCLGLITFGTFLMIAIGRRLSLSREFSLMNAYGVEKVRGLKGLTCWVVGSTLIIEALGAAALNLHFGDIYQSVFFAVMGFCNAGFSLSPASLGEFADDPLVIGVMAAETLLGGIGFLVLYNLCTFKFLRRRSGIRGRLSLNTRVVLRVTAYLIAIAFAAFLVLEWDGVLAGMDPLKKLWVGFYQAVTPRTCGFTITSTENLRPITRLVYETLMFIGGAPGSAAAGIKVTTLAVLVYTLTAMCRGDGETIIGKRVVPPATVRESIVIFMALIAFTVILTGALFVSEAGRIGTDALFFEAVSAVTTTGLSMGETTSHLSSVGRVIVMIGMFVGRLGALTVVMMIGEREAVSHVRYPGEELVVG